MNLNLAELGFNPQKGQILLDINGTKFSKNPGDFIYKIESINEQKITLKSESGKESTHEIDFDFMKNFSFSDLEDERQRLDYVESTLSSLCLDNPEEPDIIALKEAEAQKLEFLKQHNPSKVKKYSYGNRLNHIDIEIAGIKKHMRKNYLSNGHNLEAIVSLESEKKALLAKLNPKPSKLKRTLHNCCLA